MRTVDLSFFLAKNLKMFQKNVAFYVVRVYNKEKTKGRFYSEGTKI